MFKTMSPTKARREVMDRKTQALQNLYFLLMVCSYILPMRKDPAKMGTTKTRDIFPACSL